MAHDNTRTIGRPAIALNGDVLWRALGTKLDHPAIAGKAITALRRDYEVELTPL